MSNELPLAVLLQLACIQVDENLAYRLEPFKITPKQYRLLSALSGRPERFHDQNELADLLRISYGEMLDLAIYLKDRLMIERRGDCSNCQVHPAHCRHCATLRVTDYGKKINEAIEDQATKSTRDMLEPLSRDEREICIAALAKLAGLIPNVAKPPYPQNVVFLDNQTPA